MTRGNSVIHYQMNSTLVELGIESGGRDRREVEVGGRWLEFEITRTSTLPVHCKGNLLAKRAESC